MDYKIYLILIVFFTMSSCSKENKLEVEVYETSASGNKLTSIKEFPISQINSKVTLNTKKEYQTITGFGGAFTESSAYLLNRLSKEIVTKFSKLTLVRMAQIILLLEHI